MTALNKKNVTFENVDYKKTDLQLELSEQNFIVHNGGKEKPEFNITTFLVTFIALT